MPPQLEPKATNFFKSRTDLQGLDADELRREVERLIPLAELGRMAATVAHEVRNPLAGISANAELLREAVADPDDLESIDIILGEVDRLGRLVTDLLLYTRERVPNCGPLDLGRLARQVVDLSRREADKSGVELYCSGEGTGYGDPSLSRQALLNIIRNAIQACCTGGSVKVKVDGVGVTIIDQGNGIPKDIREQLFQPFVTGRTRGLGLGLAVAQRCLRRQEGEVLLERTGPDGTVFELIWREQSA